MAKKIEKVKDRHEYTLRADDSTPGPAANWLTRIGGRDEATGPKAVPNVNISRWGNIGDEAWLNINHRETVIKDERARLAKGVLEITKGDLKHRWYPKEDELEWELVWAQNPNPPQARTQSPPWYRVVFELDFPPGLRFFRQSAKHMRPGQEVPERIQGSYAVYFNKQNGAYKTGKFCHIYRPEAIDAQGKRSWCRLQVDERARTMTVLINQAWLDKAAYPVTLDPTYGYTGTPATPSSLAVGELLIAIPNAGMSEDGLAQQIHFYGRKDGAGNPDLSMGFYDNNNPHTLLDSDSTDSISDTSYGWRTQSLNLVSMASGTRYGLALVCETNTFDLPYDGGGLEDIRLWGDKSSPLPSSLNEGSTTGSWNDTFYVGGYITYTVGWAVGDVSGVGNANIGNINGIDRANIAEVNGV